MRRFWAAAVGLMIVLAAITTFLVMETGGGRLTAIVRDAGQLAFFLAAAFSCAMAGARSTGSTRSAWRLFAISAVIVAMSEVGEIGYMLLRGGEPTFPSIDDVAFLGAIPFAIGGLVAFPAARNRYATRWRLVLDLALVALSLTFISGALSIPQAFLDSRSTSALAISIGYTIADLALITAIFVSVRRSLSMQGARLVILACGLGINVFSDSISALLSAIGTLPDTLGYPLGLGSMYAYAIIALAPLWPERHSTQDQRDLAIWPDVIPYFGVLAVAAIAAFVWLTGRHIESYVALAGAGLLIVLLAGQLVSQAEARGLLVQSRRAESLVRERESMLNNVIEHAPQGVASIAVDRRITNANPRLASMLFAPLQVLVGASTDSFLPADYVGRVFRSLAGADEGSSEIYESDCQVRRADGSQFWVHWSATPIRKADGTIDYFLATFEDVTAQREAQETAVANLAQLEKLNRLKSEFVSMVSHEFRTALVGIQGFSELIRDQDIEVSEIKVLADEIYNDSQRLNRMITEMLDFDRLEAGKLRLDLKPLDLNELVRLAVEHAAVATKKHMIDSELDPGLPPVLADADRLTQVLTNLLSNAIKYSPNGGPICARTRLIGGSAEVTVTDHGRGIPPEFINRLFGRYERYEDKHAGKIIGSGLGLAITRQIVEMHGGKVAVESVVGQGSEFRFTLPLATTAAAITRSA